MSKVVFLFTVLALSLACGGGAGGVVGGANNLLSGIQINTVSQSQQAQTAQQTSAQTAESARGKLARMDIADAQTIYIANGFTVGLNTVTNALYKMASGTAQEVSFTNAENIMVHTTFEPQAVYNINADYFMACFGPVTNPVQSQHDISEMYVVEKATGKMYLMDQSIGGFPMVNGGVNGLRSDKNIQVYSNRMYFLTYDEYNGNTAGPAVVAADIIPDHLTEFLVTPASVCVSRFVVDNRGDIMYNGIGVVNNSLNVWGVLKDDNTTVRPTYTTDYWTDASGNLIHVAAGGNMTTLDVSGSTIQHSTSTMIPGFPGMLGQSRWVYNISGNTYAFADGNAWVISGNTVRTTSLGVAQTTNIEPGTDCYYFSTTTAIYKVSTSNDVVTPLTTSGLYNAYSMTVTGTTLTVAVTDTNNLNCLLTFVNDVLTTTTPLNDKKVVSVLTIR
jgi:hypothetical protein